MSPSNPPYTISFLPPPGPAVLSIPVSSFTQPSTSPTDPSIPQTFHDALAVRHVVFNLEQKCPADEEIDPDDPVSWHWVIHADSVPAATVRLIPARAHAGADDEKAVGGPSYKTCVLWDGKEPYLTVGRLATRKEFRGRGFGRVLVEEAVGWAGAHRGEVVRGWRGEDGEGAEWKGLLLIHAQARLEGWYGSIGWRTDEGMGRWDEAGIEHLGMWRRVEVKG